MRKYYDGPAPAGYLLREGDVVVAMTEQAHGLWVALPRSQRMTATSTTNDCGLSSTDRTGVGPAILVSPHERTGGTTADSGDGDRHNGTTHGNLNESRACECVCPRSRHQRQLRRVLDALDDLIENNRRRVEVLEEMARAIYREWFVRFRYPGHENVTLVDSPLGPIPEGWTVSTLRRSISNVLGGGTPSKKEITSGSGGSIRWYTPSDLAGATRLHRLSRNLRITEAERRRRVRHARPGWISIDDQPRDTWQVLAIATSEATHDTRAFIVITPDERWSPGFFTTG